MKPRSQIKTECIAPPVPDRRFDWQAWEDGHEEQGLYGYGRTEQEAVADLMSKLAERD